MPETVTATPRNNVIPDDPRFVAPETVPGEPMAAERDAALAPQGMAWPLRALAAGVTGAVLVTVLNAGNRRLTPRAARLDRFGGRAAERVAGALHLKQPEEDRRARLSPAGDLALNSACFALAAAGGRWAVPAGGAVGLAAGAGAALLPRPLGLGPQPGRHGPLTPTLTVAGYALAGLAAGAVARLMGPRRR